MRCENFPDGFILRFQNFCIFATAICRFCIHPIIFVMEYNCKQDHLQVKDCDRRMKLKKFLKDWTLPVSMIIGAVSYLTLAHIPYIIPWKPLMNQMVSVVQPLLLFCMLFLTFCKVRPQDLRIKPWHGWILLLQCGLFGMLSSVLIQMPDNHWRTVVESGMLCLICPTATAAAVVTSKLDGDAGTLTTYTILINLAVALLVPAIIPLIHPNPDFTFWRSFLLIICKVFPLLFCPFLLAMLLRWISPHTIELLTRMKDAPFYLWAVSLSLAIAVTTKTIVHSNCPLLYEVCIALISLASCVLQFSVGRWVGSKYNDKVSAAQATGQKNTVFAIWMGYTFLTPITSLAGGFYSIWHNVYNSFQLYRKERKNNLSGKKI